MERYDKSNSSEYDRIHHWIKKNYGKANRCEAVNCQGKSKVFEWAKKTEAEYDYNRANFMMLCRSCHAKMDVTAETREKMRAIQMGNKNARKQALKDK